MMSYYTGALLFALGAVIPTIIGEAAAPQADSTFLSALPTEVLSASPLLLSVNDFLVPGEVKYLLDLGQPLFQRSMITGGKISAGRTSDPCFLPGGDPLVVEIKLRATKFLRGLQFDGLEALQLVRYTTNQTINLHYDWYQGTSPLDRKHRPYNRLASFFIYLHADCEGGETWFPNVTVGRSVPQRDMTRKVALGIGDDGKGITLRAKPGSSLFWMNMENNIGDRRVLHAGLPVQTGTKIGTNILVKKNLG